MLISPGEFADTLRALGRILDLEHAHEIDLVSNEESLSVSWTRKDLPPDQRHYRAPALQEMRQRGPLSRTGLSKEPGGSYSELLRIIGQDLDRDHSNFTQIAEEPDGLVVMGTLYWSQTRQKHLLPDLLRSSRNRREWRRVVEEAPSEATDAADPPPTPRPDVRRAARTPRPDDGQMDEGPLARRLRP